jgi:hypothetical protein
MLVSVHAMKAHGGSRCTAPVILNLDTRMRKWSNSRPGRYIPCKELRHPFKMNLVGPRDGPDVSEVPHESMLQMTQ